MSNFDKKTWVDRVTSYPLRRLLTLVRDFDDTNTAVMDIERAEGTITEEGDAFSAENMNDLEDRIDEALDNVSIDVDSALSTTSTNPVQNKVITENLNIALDMIRDSSSDAYSSSKAYSVGEYVIYNNTLYKCITACSAGSWSVNSSCFEEDTLTNAVSTLTSNLTDLSEISSRISIPLGGGFTGGSGSYVTYGHIVFVEFSCYYNGTLSGGTIYNPFSGLPIPSQAFTYITPAVATNEPSARISVSDSGRLTLSPANTVSANTYFAGTFIYLI